MSLLKTFRDYVRICKDKNLLIHPRGQNTNFLPIALVNEVSHQLQLSEPKPKQNDAQLVNDYHEKIGKGSMFERKSVESYLKPLGSTYLKRANIEADEFFQKQEAQERHIFNKNLKSLENSSTVMFNLEQENIRLILEKLVAVTPAPPDPTTAAPKISLNDESKRYKKKPPSHVYTEIPPVPDFYDVSVFEEYIYLLTHSTFHHKKSSKFNGIIPKILKNLFHPLNSNTISLRTVNSYNDVIFYFSKKWNIATCRELLVQMKIENVKPNATTFNLMLKNLLTHQTIRHVADPYKISLQYLTEMKKYGIEADLVTWNIMFNLLKDDIIDVSLLNVVIKKLIQEQQIYSAWKVIDHSKKEFSFNPNVDQMNLLLVPFSNTGRVDLVVATMNTFKKRYKVKPNYDTYNLVMKSVSRARHWDGKLSVLRILYHKMMLDLKQNVAGEYWIRRTRARLKFIYQKDVELKPDLTTEEAQLKSDMELLRWGLDSDVIDLSKKIPDQFEEITAKLGFSKEQRDALFIDDLDRKKIKMKKYKNRIGFLSIQKSLVDRIPYAEDSYAALKKEMNKRRLIET
ncbi:unnamed protein product [Wickerhamomyces anomalus]